MSLRSDEVEPGTRTSRHRALCGIGVMRKVIG
jgi:hypothetical protein